MKRDVEKDKKLCEKATKGPWYRQRTNETFHGFALETLIADTAPGCTGNKIWATPMEGSYPANDADFIAMTREALPHYIKRAEKLEKAWRDYADKIFTSHSICPMDSCPQGDTVYPDKDVCHKCWLDFIDGLCEED